MSDYILYMDDGTELYHHGIPNQKHGVRHGPPYPLDKKVSAKIRSGEKVRVKPSSFKKIFSQKKAASNSAKQEKTSDEKSKKRKLSELSDDEIRARINRMKLEQEYKDLVKSVKPEKKPSPFRNAGKEIYNKLLNPAIGDVAKQVIAPYVVYKLGTGINNKAGINVVDTTYIKAKNKKN